MIKALTSPAPRWAGAHPIRFGTGARVEDTMDQFLQYEERMLQAPICSIQGEFRCLDEMEQGCKASLKPLLDERNKLVDRLVATIRQEILPRIQEAYGQPPAQTDELENQLFSSLAIHIIPQPLRDHIGKLEDFLNALSIKRRLLQGIAHKRGITLPPSKAAAL